MSGYVQSNQPILLPDAAYTVSAADTGKLLYVPVVAAARAITLPPLALGLHYRFMIKAAAATAIGFDVTISPAVAANVMYGVLLTRGVSAITIATALINAAPSVLFDATAVAGDYIDFHCDGTFWHVSGASQIAAGIA